MALHSWNKRTILVVLFFVHVYFVTFVIILPWLLKDLPFSLYFGLDNSQNQVVGDILKRNFNNYFQEIHYLENIPDIIRNPSEQYTFAVGVVTIKRLFDKSQLGYLTQVLAALHRNTNKNYICNICNVDAGPGVHKEAQQMAVLFKEYARFPTPSPAHVIMNTFEKEKQDYLYCMKNLLNISAEYIFVFEDDAVVIDNFSFILDYVLTKLNVAYPDWGILKLFYPPRWQGFSIYEPQSLFELNIIGTIGIFCYGGIYICLKKYANKRYKLSFSKTLLFICSLGYVYSALIAISIGRQNILEFYRVLGWYFVVDAPGCCSPAILYKTSTAKHLVDHLEHVQCHQNYPLDKAIDDYKDKYGIKAFLVMPSLVRHIGLVSSLKGVSRNLEEFINI